MRTAAKRALRLARGFRTCAAGAVLQHFRVVDAPTTRYTRAGDLNIAYQVVGEGPFDLVFVPSMAQHVELIWEVPPQARFLSRLASISRLLLFDKRGTGMSDRVVVAPTLEARMDDIRAVMDAADSERAVLFGLRDSGSLCALFAATYPEANVRPRVDAYRSMRGPDRGPSVASVAGRGRTSSRRSDSPLG